MRHYGIIKKYNSILILKKLSNLGSGVYGYKNMEYMDRNTCKIGCQMEVQVICVGNSEEPQSLDAMGRVVRNGFTVRVARFSKQKYKMPT